MGEGIHGMADQGWSLEAVLFDETLDVFRHDCVVML